MAIAETQTQAARIPGRLANTGTGPTFAPIDIGHPDYMAVVEPDTAFWSLVRKDSLADVLTGKRFLAAYLEKAEVFAAQMDGLRFGLTPSAVYFNPTERCNLNCAYCYIPADMRAHGEHMSASRLIEALEILETHFRKVMPEGRLPQIVFHGAEPLLNREAVFAGIEKFDERMRFGVQTNATLLDDEAISFLTGRGVGIGISLDGRTAEVADRARVNWNGQGVSKKVVTAMKKLRGYPGFNVICTVTAKNLHSLPGIAAYFHENEVPACLLNMVRCTLPGAREIKPDDEEAATWFIKALEKTHELYRKTGRKLVVANFANIILGVVAPTARRLMCDISPCGGGRCFFALAPSGDVFPCSEFVGLPDFKGGNLFADQIPDILKSEAFAKVTGRKVEDIEPCKRCTVRHFCGSPCPAEAVEMNGGMDQPGAFCRFYERQVRYALKLIAEGRHDDFLWDGWDEDAETVFDLRMT